NLHDVLRDTSTLAAYKTQIDIELSALIYLYAVWGMVYEYKNLDSIYKSRTPFSNMTGSSSMVLSSRHQELRQLLLQFERTSVDWDTRDLFPHRMMVLNL